MDWLNYHHLFYFWTVAREGSVSKAAEKLRLAQPTVSAQLRMLEASLGERLFERRGRRLILTDVGQVVRRYADEIFALGREMQETLKGRPSGRPPVLTVGVANVVPKLIVFRMLQPALDADPPVHLVCREDSPDHLVAQLSTHGLDVVISDAVAPPHVRVRAFNHLLGESGLTFFASTPFARRLSGRFPRSLDGVPMLLPSTNTTTRRALDDWFETVGVRPRVVAEFEDSALMKAFGEGGGAVFVAPTAIGREVSRHYNVRAIGRTEAVRERYYAISVERRLTHPGVLAITHAARGLLPMPAR